ncbi:MAG: J domain-containing protein [Phycisphaerae bacterium]
MADRDYYDILGVSRSASDDEIKRAYRKLAKRFHPDANRGDASAETKFKEVQAAYDALSDPEKRRTYDQFGHAGPQSGGRGFRTGRGGHSVEFDFTDLSDLFDFGPSSGGRGGIGSLFERLAQRGGRGVDEQPPGGDLDLEHAVVLTFEQALRGAALDVRPTDGVAAGQTISLKIPPGVDDGQRIRVRGKGLRGRRGQMGDLFIVCRVEPHAYFRRVGNDVYVELPISVAEAALGAKVDIPTLDGPATVKVPPGTPSGAKLRLAGRGIEDPRSHERGDQFAVIKIVPPRTLSPRQERLLEELSQTLEESPRDGLWNR